ncbi:MAG: hypothetical protein FVQ77_01530 [Cytophagales bacterium]|nr:hypothetical protein [Cytophagales bacterium]
MYLKVYLSVFAIICSCSGENGKNMDLQYFNVDYNNIEEVQVLHRKTNKKILVANKKTIEQLFSDYINDREKNIAKFMPEYIVDVKYRDSIDTYLISGYYINMDDITYKMKRNFNDFYNYIIEDNNHKRHRVRQ